MARKLVGRRYVWFKCSNLPKQEMARRLGQFALTIGGIYTVYFLYADAKKDSELYMCADRDGVMPWRYLSEFFEQVGLDCTRVMNCEFSGSSYREGQPKYAIRLWVG